MIITAAFRNTVHHSSISWAFNIFQLTIMGILSPKAYPFKKRIIHILNSVKIYVTIKNSNNSELFSAMNCYNPYKNPMRQKLLVSSLSNQKLPVSERLSNLDNTILKKRSQDQSLHLPDYQAIPCHFVLMNLKKIFLRYIIFNIENV